MGVLQQHLVHFYEKDDGLLSNVGRYIGEGLQKGDGILVIGTPEHIDSFQRHLDSLGCKPDSAIRDRRLVFIDAGETLARFMVDGQPDWGLFEKTLRPALWYVRAHASNMHLRTYGEMAGVLWKTGNVEAAIRLEEFWNKLLKSSFFSLFCSYPIDVLGDEFRTGGVEALLCAHTRVIPAGLNGDLESAIDRAIDDILGTRAPELRESLTGSYRPAWASIPRAESTILWLRNNLPDHAEDILSRARQYHQALAN